MERRDTDEWDDVEDDGVIDPSDSLEDGPDPLDTGIAPADRWAGANRFGTTAAEQRAGESVEQLLAEEEPDVDPYAPDGDDEDELARRGYQSEPRSGRLVADDDDLLGRDVGIDVGAASAEEAAVHVVEDPDGPGDGPLR